MPENKEIPEELRMLADRYVTSHTDSEVRRMYGHHFRSFRDGAYQWTDRQLIQLMHWIVLNMQSDSYFLTPQPTATVSVKELLDKIAELRGIDPEENGIQFNRIAHTNLNDENL